MGTRPVIVSLVVDLSFLTRTAIVTIPAIGAIKPNGEDVAIMGEQFPKLIAIIGDVLRATVVLVITIPRREINAELEPMPVASFGDLLDYVALAVPPRAA